jgi:hypothetical protein
MRPEEALPAGQSNSGREHARLCYVVRADLVEWLFTLFAKALPAEVVAWVWDQLLVGGEEVLLGAAVAVLQLLEPTLLQVIHFSDHSVPQSGVTPDRPLCMYVAQLADAVDHLSSDGRMRNRSSSEIYHSHPAGNGARRTPGTSGVRRPI